MVFSIVTELYNHHHNKFSSPQKKIRIFSNHSPFPIPQPLPIPRQPLIYFLSLFIFLLWTFHIYGIIQSVVFCDSFLSLNIVFFKVHPCCNMYQNFIPFMKSLYGYTIFCLSIPQLMGMQTISTFGYY